MKLDLLVLTSHPDDAELGCSGTILLNVAQGKKVGIVDFTEGEMGTNGTVETRKIESEKAAKILGLSIRENLKFEDVFFKDDKWHQIEIVKIIRKYQPEIIITNAKQDRHPDHGRAANLVLAAYFMAGLKKLETSVNDMPQLPWRPKAVYHFIQSNYIKPDFIVDISEVWEKKLESIRAYSSQFHNAGSQLEKTFISTPEFMRFVEARAVEFGQAIGVKYGEGFTSDRKIGVKNIFDLM